MDFHIWLAFVLASTLLLLIPGPTVLLVLSYAISQGRRVALSTAAGVAFGDLLAMTASLAGLGAMVLASAKLFIVLKFIGAAYLIYLGIKLYRSAPSSALAEISEVELISSRKIFSHATAVTALNPKSIVFFIAFVPQFIQPESALLPQFIILTATFVGLATVNAFAYAFLADYLRQQIKRPSVMSILTRMGGVALVLMGIATATFRRANG